MINTSRNRDLLSDGNEEDDDDGKQDESEDEDYNDNDKEEHEDDKVDSNDEDEREDDNIDDEVVNQLDIADGLKDMLVRRGFKLESLLSMRPGDLAETLGIDEYVAKIIMDSATAIVTIKKLKPKLCII